MHSPTCVSPHPGADTYLHTTVLEGVRGRDGSSQRTAAGAFCSSPVSKQKARVLVSLEL